MSSEPAVWFPAVRTGTGTDVFTERLVSGLRRNGLRAEITWLPLRAEYAPWTVPIPQPPLWATVTHVNTWLNTRFLPPRIPILATIHHAIHHPDVRAYKNLMRASYHDWWIAPNERRVLAQSSQIVAVSKFAADSARETLLNVPSKVIHNGVDTEVFQPAPPLRQKDAPFLLLYVGSWKTLKGIHLLPPILRDLGPGFELHYTGGGAAVVDKPHMPPNMRDLGRLENANAVAMAMQQADALLFPSRSEGFGLVAAEAMACGLPIVAARSASLSEIIADGRNGLLCSQDDPAEFANAIRILAGNASLRSEMALAARRDAVARFSEHRMIDAYINTYRHMTCALEE